MVLKYKGILPRMVNYFQCPCFWKEVEKRVIILMKSNHEWKSIYSNLFIIYLKKKKWQIVTDTVCLFWKNNQKQNWRANFIFGNLPKSRIEVSVRNLIYFIAFWKFHAILAYDVKYLICMIPMNKRSVD